jgi:hypothetical protein
LSLGCFRINETQDLRIDILILGDGLDQLITLVAEVSCLASSGIAKALADVLLGKIAKADKALASERLPESAIRYGNRTLQMLRCFLLKTVSFGELFLRC